MKLPFPIREATHVVSEGAAQSTRLASRFLEAQRKGAPLLLTATAVGALTGTVASLFHKVLDWADKTREVVWATDNPLMTWGIIPAGVAIALLISVWLVRAWAPQAGGSGVQVVEGLLDGVLSMRWARVIPVKFIGGFLALGSGLLMGREGPSIQIGAAIGQGCVKILRLPKTLM
ncbi:MAG: chloride channel protein, partial [Myxococcota bacterium]